MPDLFEPEILDDDDTWDCDEDEDEDTWEIEAEEELYKSLIAIDPTNC
jgi:hypothetical protein